jgi:hypothetical protein
MAIAKLCDRNRSALTGVAISSVLGPVDGLPFGTYVLPSKQLRDIEPYQAFKQEL